MTLLDNTSLESASLKSASFNRGVSKPQGLKLLFWKGCLLSVVLHAAFAVLPWPQQTVSSQEDADLGDEAAVESSLAITTVSLPPTVLPEASSTVEPSPAVVASPPAERTADLPPPVQPREVLQPVVPPVLPPVRPSVPVQAIYQEPVPSEPTPQPQPETTEESVGSEVPESLPESSLGAEPEYGKVMPLSDAFPHLVGAQSGCYGLSGCRQLSSNFRMAARQLIEQMKAQGYEIAARDDLEDTGHRVFEAIAPEEPGKVYYLNVFSPDVGSTVYVITTEILSLAELEQLSG